MYMMYMLDFCITTEMGTDMGMYIPICTMCLEMGEDMIEILPAAHTLTGCDTKLALRKKLLLS